MGSNSYVVKVQHEGTLRRLTLQTGEEPVFSYAHLQRRVRDLFKVSPTAQVVLTYVDRDGDVVSMADDQDLQDSLVMQSLNPLRMNMIVINENSDVKINSSGTQEQSKSDAVTEVEQRTTYLGETAADNVILKSPSVDPAANDDQVLTSNFNKNSAPAPGKEAMTDYASGTYSSDDTPENAVDEKEVSAEGGAIKDKLRSPRAATAAAEEDGSDRDIHMHHGIRCDGCGMIPLTGPRFKSCKKSNYDLCLQCFQACSAEQNEYVKIDRRFYRLAHPTFFGRMMGLSPAFESRGVNPDQSVSLTSDSAVDANINKVPAALAKEEEVDPSRVMHCGVQCDECGVIPIQGPRFKSCTRFNYDLCLACFEKSGSNAKEYSRLDQPATSRGYPPVMGRMIGRLAVPTYRIGSMCGRGVWVLNQMIPKESDDQSATEKKTTAAPESAVNVGGDVMVVNDADAESAAVSTSGDVSKAKTEAGVLQDGSDSKPEGDVEEQTVDAKALEIAIPILSMDTNAVVNINLSSGPNANMLVDAQNSESEDVTASADLSTLEGLLAKLVAMGFTDQTLNAELLERNKFDLRKTLDDLCAAEEWDPMLGDLQEMGFYNANMNRRALIKNNGSVKRAVKELVQRYKGEQPIDGSGVELERGSSSSTS